MTKSQKYFSVCSQQIQSFVDHMAKHFDDAGNRTADAPTAKTRGMYFIEFHGRKKVKVIPEMSPIKIGNGWNKPLRTTRNSEGKENTYVLCRKK